MLQYVTLAVGAIVGTWASDADCAEVRSGMAQVSSCCTADWRDELPPSVREIVARVDRQDPVATDDPEAQKREARHQADLKSDAELGAKYAAEIAKDPKMKVSTNAEMIARLQRIGAEIAQIANTTPVEVTWGDSRLNPFSYQFTVLQGDDVNAFSIPGGYIYFYEGLIKYAESDDELAGVVAHEIAHASFRHVATLRREASKLDVIQIPLILVAILTGGAAAQGALLGGTLVGTALTSGWSVKAEQAADYGGFQYMRKSRYNPVGLLTFMERLAYDDRNKAQFDWGIFQTHPPSRERAQVLVRRLGDAGIPIRRSLVTQSFRTQIKPGDDGTVEITLASVKIFSFAGTDALLRADEAAANLDAFFDRLPKMFEVGVDGKSLTGRGKVLFTVTDEEAALAKQPIADLVEEAARRLKRVAYDLSYRTWDAQF
jgi:hypothetical protein